MIAKCLNAACANLFYAEKLETAVCPVCKGTSVCNGDAKANLLRMKMRRNKV